DKDIRMLTTRFLMFGATRAKKFLGHNSIPQAKIVSGKALAQCHSLSHSRPHSPSEAGRKTRPLAFVTQRVTATLVAK
ncbi:MAG TPA: hypothetical protein PLY87_28740, partial [Planctomycetaceae bacterium]|nr:hypothetical protein [Planctomycetaceae bacterium]